MINNWYDPNKRMYGNPEIYRLISDYLEKRYDGIEQIHKTWKKQIGTLLLSLSAFKLSTNEINSSIIKNSRMSINVPIEIVRLGINDIMKVLGMNDVVELWKAIIVPKIKSAGTGIRLLEDYWDLFAGELDSADFDIRKGHVSSLYKLIQSLRSINTEEMLNHLLKEEDIAGQVRDFLGVYFHRDSSQRIELYAEKIIISAELLGVGVEALTFVVLVHEMTHAYTISGFDLNGDQGQIKGKCCDKNIVEGVAQFYTDAICRQMEDRIPGVYSAFSKLMNFQPSPYTRHRQWFIPFAYNHEKVRKAFLLYRNNPDLHSLDFEKALH